MGDEALSRAEMEALLGGANRAADKSTGHDQRPAPVAVSPADTSFQTATSGSHQSGAVEPECLRALRTLHEGLGSRFGAALSTLARATVKVGLSGVDVLAYSDFVRTCENPTCWNVLRAEPLPGKWALAISPAILLPIIERLLGGGHESTPPARRPLTQIEARLAARVTSLYLRELGRAWQNVLLLTLSVERVENDPRVVPLARLAESIVRIGFELTLGEHRGRMDLCIPLSSIEGTTVRSAVTWRQMPGQNQAALRYAPRRPPGLRGSIVEVTAQLAETTIRQSELADLGVGDIITTRQPVSGPAIVAVEAVPKFRATVGQHQGHKAIQIQERISPPPAAGP